MTSVPAQPEAAAADVAAGPPSGPGLHVVSAARPRPAIDAASSLGFVPEAWLGATAPGGLALPSAMPAADTMYAPRGVWFDDERMIAADSGNHRVLLWNRVPDRDHVPADVVLGQPDMASEGPKLLHLPTGVAIIDGRLVVADAWHHRLLVWHDVPTVDDTPPDVVIGQADLGGTDPNRGEEAARRDGFYWPYAFGCAGKRFFVADTGNRRVVGWWSLEHAIAGEPPRFPVHQQMLATMA